MDRAFCNFRASITFALCRLFTAADSDDICTAIQYVKKARPWTTLMGIGWGYGANMLTKHLAEVGETTPLTAAVCIDNPFDLEEATRSFPHHVVMDQKLAVGLADILRANKVFFLSKWLIGVYVFCFTPTNNEDNTVMNLK